jgi:uncharacterized tellurite resistance protein B-like protein
VLDRIRSLFSEQPEQTLDDDAALHLAAAVLLIEVAKADHSLDGLEIQRLQKVLKREWTLADTDLEDLVAVARGVSDDSVSLHTHVDVINRRYDAAQKFALVRGLWQVACADAEIHHYEEALIRRLADLIHVSHSDFIRAKHEAQGIR